MSATRSALILEDEPIIGFALEDMLLGLGFEDVALVTTLTEAREHLKSHVPQVAILDVNIHGERSYDLAAELAQREVPFIFATGYGDAEHPEGLKAVATLTKPYSLPDLKSALAATLG